MPSEWTYTHIHVFTYMYICVSHVHTYTYSVHMHKNIIQIQESRPAMNLEPYRPSAQKLLAPHAHASVRCCHSAELRVAMPRTAASAQAFKRFELVPIVIKREALMTLSKNLECESTLEGCCRPKLKPVAESLLPKASEPPKACKDWKAEQVLARESRSVLTALRAAVVLKQPELLETAHGAQAQPIAFTCSLLLLPRTVHRRFEQRSGSSQRHVTKAIESVYTSCYPEALHHQNDDDNLWFDVSFTQVGSALLVLLSDICRDSACFRWCKIPGDPNQFKLQDVSHHTTAC